MLAVEKESSLAVEKKSSLAVEKGSSLAVENDLSLAVERDTLHFVVRKSLCNIATKSLQVGGSEFTFKDFTDFKSGFHRNFELSMKLVMIIVLQILNKWKRIWIYDRRWRLPFDSVHVFLLVKQFESMLDGVVGSVTAVLAVNLCRYFFVFVN